MTVFRYPTAFVIAFAADPPTNAKIAVEVARQLAKSGGLRNNWIASAPANWQLSDFFNQCQTDLTNAQTLGAFIVYNASTETGNRSYILLGRGWSKLDADVMFVSCAHWKTGSPPAYQMQVSWLSNGVMGVGWDTNFPFLPWAAIVSGLSSYNQALHPTSTQVNTYSFPTPTPVPSALPSGFAPTGTLTGISVTTTSNPLLGGTLTAEELGLATAVSQSAFASVNFLGNNHDYQLRIAIQKFAKKIVDPLKASCSPPSPQATPPPNPAPVDLCNVFDGWQMAGGSSPAASPTPAAMPTPFPVAVPSAQEIVNWMSSHLPAPAMFYFNNGDKIITANDANLKTVTSPAEDAECKITVFGIEPTPTPTPAPKPTPKPTPTPSVSPSPAGKSEKTLYALQVRFSPIPTITHPVPTITNPPQSDRDKRSISGTLDLRKASPISIVVNKVEGDFASQLDNGSFAITFSDQQLASRFQNALQTLARECKATDGLF
jgi:hypothetical protein